jgi:hypothetical protein
LRAFLEDASYLGGPVFDPAGESGERGGVGPGGVVLWSVTHVVTEAKKEVRDFVRFVSSFGS